MSYRKKEFSRPKPDNLEKLNALEKDATFPTEINTPSSERTTTAANSEMRGENPSGSRRLFMGSQVKEILPDAVRLETSEGGSESIGNDQVFVMTGREAPLDFSGVQEWPFPENGGRGPGPDSYLFLFSAFFFTIGRAEAG